MEKELPWFIELDVPIPEELQVGYEFARYDIAGIIPEPKIKQSEEYKNIICKFETLACFWQKKQEIYRKINEKLAEKVEINLFPLILDKSMNVPPNTPEKGKFIISISGKKRSKFFHNKLVEYFKIYKKDLLLGYIQVKETRSEFILNDP